LKKATVLQIFMFVYQDRWITGVTQSAVNKCSFNNKSF